MNLPTLGAGQRKHFMFVEMLIALCVLCWFGSIDGEIFKVASITSFLAAIGGNAFEHYTKTKPNGSTP